MQPLITRFAVRLAALVIFAPCLIPAQPVGPIIIGDKVRIHSEILKEDRILWIYAPDKSHDTGVQYPLMILLDGDTHFIHATGIVQFLSDAGRMPKMTVVGVESTDRVRDFTPAPPDSTMPGSGGADAFMRFLSDELLPYVESRYPVAPLRILVGHSLGGSLVLNTLLTHPHMFNAYFILSPNLWWDSDTLVNRVEPFLRNAPTPNAFIYETHTTRESPRNIAAAARLLDLIHTWRVDSLDWEFRYFPTESHQSIVHRSIYDGLEQLFSPWEIQADLSVIGMPGLLRHYRKLSDRYRYTIIPPEELVNGLGYHSLSRGNFAEAIDIFTWNARHYPRSSNVYDSLGEAYAKKGDTTLAIECYEKSITLNSNNTPGIQILKKLKAR